MKAGGAAEKQCGSQNVSESQCGSESSESSRYCCVEKKQTRENVNVERTSLNLRLKTRYNYIKE